MTTGLSSHRRLLLLSVFVILWSGASANAQLPVSSSRKLLLSEAEEQEGRARAPSVAASLPDESAARSAGAHSKNGGIAVPLIVGGSKVPHDRYKYMAALMDDYGEPYCSGALIAPDIVLTAGHCVDFIDYYDMEMTVKIGARRWDSESEGFLRKYEKYIVHPNFNTSWEYYDLLGDIGLVVLSEPVPEDWPVLQLPNKKTAIPKNLTVLGYGSTDEWGWKMSRILREADVNYIGRKKCRRMLSKTAPDTFKITKATLCAGLLEGGKDACWGDSGGPLIAKGESDASDVAFGLTSFGEGCARPATPGGYSNVRKYSRWIQRKVRQHSKFVNE